jgi:sugar-phosphatase
VNVLVDAVDRRDGCVARLLCAAMLFDMDGTIVDSRRCVERKWRAWAARRGLDPAAVLAGSQGLRNEDTIRLFAPDLDAEAESAALKRHEERCRDGIVAVAGAARLLHHLPAQRWAVVTSAWMRLARLRLHCAGLPIPAVLVTSDDVEHGKPDPEGYLQAAHRLKVSPRLCVVVEDAGAGIAAARAAGMRVIAVTAASPPGCLDPDAVIGDLTDVSIRDAARD